MRIEEEIKQKAFRSEHQKATINLLFTAGWLNNKQRDFFKPFDITPQQYNVLRILRGQYPKQISTSSIKARMLDKNSDASRIVDRLFVKELVSKKPCDHDKRLVDVTITAEGLKLLTDMEDKVNALDDTINLSKEEAELLNKLLDRLRN